MSNTELLQKELAENISRAESIVLRELEEYPVCCIDCILFFKFANQIDNTLHAIRITDPFKHRYIYHCHWSVKCPQCSKMISNVVKVDLQQLDEDTHNVITKKLEAERAIAAYKTVAEVLDRSLFEDVFKNLGIS